MGVFAALELATVPNNLRGGTLGGGDGVRGGGGGNSTSGGGGGGGGAARKVIVCTIVGILSKELERIGCCDMRACVRACAEKPGFDLGSLLSIK